MSAGPSQILPGLFIGSEQDARLLAPGFDYVVNCTSDVPIDEDCQDWDRVAVRDRECDVQLLFQTLCGTAVLDNIHKYLSDPDNTVLVHCHAGIQRSPTVVGCYLIKHHDMTPERARELIRENRPVAFTCGPTLEPAMTLMHQHVHPSVSGSLDAVRVLKCSPFKVAHTRGDARPHDGASEVLPGLYLGNTRDSLLSQGRFDCIVNCTPNEPFPAKARHCVRVPVHDLEEDSYPLFQIMRDSTVLGVLDQHLSHPEKKVLVHCQAGVSRSSTVVACYLIKYKGYTPEDAIKFIKEKRPVAFRLGVRFQRTMKFMYEHVSRESVKPRSCDVGSIQQ